MNKKKLLAENFVIYGLGQMLYKIIPVVMLPVLVRMIPDSSRCLGINDLAGTLVSFVSAVGLMGLYDALFRLFFDYTDEQIKKRRQICSTALLLTVFFSTACLILVVFFRSSISAFFFEDRSLENLVILCGINVVLSNVENILLTPTRMLNERKRFIAGNVLVSIFSYSVAFLLIVNGYYIIALPLGMTLSLVSGILYFGYYNSAWFRIGAFSKKQVKPLLKIGVPLFPSFLIFWVFSSFDKVMILKMLGVGANGLYAAANKLASISQLITSAFAAGWSYFNFATMNDEKRVEDFSKIVEYILAVGAGAFLLCRISGSWIIRLFFTEAYKDAGSVFSYLFFAPVVCMCFQLMGSQFLLVKKTVLSTLIAGSGVAVNILFNYIWIDQYQVLGAGMATVVSYMVILVIAGFVLMKMRLFRVHAGMLLALLFFGMMLCLDCLQINHSIIALAGTVMLACLSGWYVKKLKKCHKEAP